MSESSIDGAVVVTDKILPGRFVPYVVYMVTPKAGQDASGRVLAIINDMGPETPAGLVAAAVELDKIMDQTTRKNHGDDVVISFSPKRFDPNNPAHVAEAREIVAETMSEVMPDSPHLAVLQGDNGVLHAHIPAPNHNITTGRARRTGWHHQEWRNANDEALRRRGIEPIVPGRATQSEVERVAAARGRLVPGHDELIAMSPSEITPRELDSYLSAHIAEALIDGRLDAVPEPGASVLLPIDGGKSLSVRRGGRGGLSYAVTDGEGSPLRTAPGKRGAKPTPIARSAGKLDRAHHTIADGDTALYGPLWLADQIAAMSATEQEIDRDREDVRRREIEALEAAARAEAARAAEHAAGTDTEAGTVVDGRDATDRGVGTDAGTEADTNDFDILDTEPARTADEFVPAVRGQRRAGDERVREGGAGSADAGASRRSGERAATARRDAAASVGERAEIDAMLIDDAVGDTAGHLAAAASARTARRHHTHQRGL